MTHLTNNKALQAVQTYHQQSKHHFQHYASGPDGLDWNNQPEAFRSFAGSPKIELPLMEQEMGLLYNDLYQPEKITPRELSLKNIARLLELSFGLSAWKQYGDNRWALRCNPSSGNLHPTEFFAAPALVVFLMMRYTV